MKLENSVAIITGAGRGIGRAIALAYAREGATVIVAARSADEINETVWLIEELGYHAHAVQTDVRSGEQVDHLVAQTLQHHRAPDILVNSAGIGLRVPLIDTNEEQWDAVHETLLKGTYLVTRACLPHMIDQGQGNIINIGAPIEKLALPGFSAYCSAKYGVEGLTRALAKEVRRHGININALHPGGYVDTHLMRQIASEASKGVLPPDEVAQTAIELAAQKPRGRSGETINAHTWEQAA
jgi:3-oxoacyl-[acyl-carrier protein] reductase